ncbi:MAG TPA: translation initiation factor IF-2, partial [Anaeromyxobacteraceae bacterium]
MSKKRVHELGKQLKEQGIELSNTELVDKLHALGYTDVKSHSSSLEDDQAATAYEKIVGEKKPKPAPAKPSGPGFVVRKKAHTDVPAQPAPAHAPLHAHAPANGVEYEEPSPAFDAAPEPAAAPAAPVAPQAAPLAAEVAQPAPEATAPAATDAQAHAPQPQPAAQQPSAPAPAHAPPAPARPAMPHAPAMAAAPAQPRVDPRTVRPTSTQAVVISRPTTPVRRVTPPSAGRHFPAAPGPRALGEVRELKVVPGMLGREREFIDV